MTAEQKKIYNRERYIGRKAAKMAEDFVIKQLKMELTIHNKGDVYKKIKPLLEATKVKAKMGQFRLLGLNFTSSKIGFIHHYGFSGVRSGSTILLKAQRYNESAARRKDHRVKIDSTDAFTNIYVQSGAADYLLNGLAETRAEAIKVSINNLVLQLNTQDEQK